MRSSLENTGYSLFFIIQGKIYEIRIEIRYKLIIFYKRIKLLLVYILKFTI